MYVIVTTHPFTQFLLDQADQRKLSIRQFAKFLGVNHEVITRFMNSAPSEEVGYPSLHTLRKIAGATGVSMLTLFDLVFPDDDNLDIAVEARLLAEQITHLPPEKRALAEGYIRDALGQRGKE